MTQAKIPGTVTILGAGALGSAMAARRGDTGQRVRLWNRRSAQAQTVAAGSSGVVAVDKLTNAVRGSSAVITVLRDGDAVARVMSEAIGSFARAWVADRRHGPLPILLLVLTINTGVVDAVSILSLGRVFVANMTGNVAFVGFAAAGAVGFSLGASLWALGGFLVGAYFGGLLVRRRGADRGRLFAVGVLIETVLFVVALVVSALGGRHLNLGGIDAIAAIAAAALGLQNAVVRKLAVPDLTTTVLTMTLTGIAADTNPAGRGATIVRRALAVTAMFAGAVGGALIVLHEGRTAALGLVLALVALVSISAVVAARKPSAWRTPGV